MFNVRRFLANKNTVTIIGVLLAILILYFGYNYRIQQAIRPQRLPYALKTIQPREKITADMVGYINVPPRLIMGDILLDASLIIGRNANYNTIIPTGSLFYKDAVTTAAQLPDYAFTNIPKNHIPFNFVVNTESTYGNSMFPDNYINIYFKALNEEGKVIIGKLIENVKILAVKDSSGKHVFENTEIDRTPHTLLFSVPEDIHLLLRKALYLSSLGDIKAELIPVPNITSYHEDIGSLTVSNQYLRTYIEVNTGFVPEDQLPDVEKPSTDQSDQNEVEEEIE